MIGNLLTKHFLDERLVWFLDMLDPSLAIDFAKIVPEIGPATVEAVAKSTMLPKTKNNLSHLITEILPPRFGCGPPNKTVPTNPVSCSSCSSMNVMLFTTEVWALVEGTLASPKPQLHASTDNLLVVGYRLGPARDLLGI
jgi:hypothetical protein